MILVVAISGILAISNVPDVILLVAISGILAISNVPDVILVVAISGILAISNVPDVILPVPKLGISVSVKLKVILGDVVALPVVIDNPEPTPIL